MATLIGPAIAALKASGVATALAAGGTILSTVGAIQQGNAANRAAEFNAKQLEAAGKAEYAASTLEAAEENRQKELALSRARAVGAASGGGQDIALMGAIEEEGVMRGQNILWQGEEAMKGRKNQAAATRFEGRQARNAGYLKAGSTLMSGGASFFEKYGGEA